MFKQKKKGILNRISTMLLAVILLVTMCPTDMAYVMAEENPSTEMPLGDTWTAPDSSYSITGGNVVGDWYTDKVKISAQTGYQISTDGVNWSAELADVVVDDTTSAGVEVAFYIQEEATGNISTAITKNIKKDAAGPHSSITSSEGSVWDKLLTFLKKDGVVSYTISSDDAASGVAKTEYYVAENEAGTKSAAELDAVSAWTEYSSPIDIDKNKVYVVYAKITDNAGNYTYVSTNGIIHETNAPTISFQTDALNTVKFSNDFTVDITITDGTPSSGIKDVKWEVFCNGTSAQDGTIEPLMADFDNPAFSDLQSTITDTITILKEKNPNGDIILKVTATDFSGNIGENTVQYTMLKEQKIVFPQTEYELEKGEFFEGPKAAEEGDEYGTGTITYSIAEDSASIVKSLDSSTGAVTLEAKEGSAKIKATKAADDVYAEASAVYTVTIQRWIASGDSYIITDGKVNDARWYTSDVSIDAKTGYLLSTDESDWKESLGVVVTEDTTGKDITFYVKESATGKISDLITKTIKKDAVYPTGSIQCGEVTFWDDFLSFFGNKHKDTYEITYSDETSKVNKVEYYIDEGTTDVKSAEELNKISKWQEYSNAFSVDTAKVYVVYGKITDNAGLSTYVTTNGIIRDEGNPEITILTDDKKSTGYNDVFCDDIYVNITASDNAPSSGLKKLEWKVYQGETLVSENLKQSGSVEPQVKNNPSYSELETTLTEDITIQKDLYTDGKITLVVDAIDFSGRTSSKNKVYIFNRTNPAITVSYDNNNIYKEVNGTGYFDNVRTATITIQERSELFNKEKANAGIQISATKLKDNEITVPVISEWKTTKGNTGAEDTHTATISFTQNGKYALDVSYTNDLKQTAGCSEKDDVKAPYDFIIDMDKPTAEITVGAWSFQTLLNKPTFGLYSNKSEKVVIASQDATTQVEAVYYYISNQDNVMTKTEIEKLTSGEWRKYAPFYIPINTKSTIYAKVVDDAGNIEYISTNGIVIDDRKPVMESVEPKIEISAPYGSTTIYTGNVTVNVKVKDEAVGADNVCAGIKNIRYEVTCNGETTQTGELYNYDSKKEAVIKTIWESDATNYIVVDHTKNNGNDIKVKVTATDNAGNVSEKILDLRIDTQIPVIYVAYANNAGVTEYGDVAHFNAGRSATITIQEHNFEPTGVHINSNGSLSEWESDPITGINTATISFSTDGDYHFDISCQDVLGYTSGGVNYGSSVAPTRFVVDTTKPVINVTYDNHNAINGNYYNDTRMATIEVNEHNFDPNKTKLTVTATDNGQPVDLPSMSNWVGNGDIYTATIVYDKDALYTFDFECQDKVGNVADDIPMDTFYVDKTRPVVTIANIFDKSANSGEGNIGFVITATDTNFDIFTPVLTAVIKEGDAFVTKQITGGVVSNIANGQRYAVSNVDTDGIYRITCTVIDKAGNEYQEVTLENPDGSTYVEERFGTDTLLTFSTNRQGSVYELTKETSDIVSKYYVQNVLNDIVIVEVNTDSLKEQKITLNGKVLKEGTDYTVTVEGEENEWKKYTYSVSNALFETEGQYQLVASSTDMADNVAFSDVKNATVNFVVDRTPPVITVSGMENDGRYQVESQRVTLIPTDDGGALASILVCTVDEEGNILKEIVNLEGEALTKALEENEGIITFKVEEGMYQNIRIICKDNAMDGTGNPNIYDNTFSRVSVSTSAVKMLFANQNFIYGAVIGILFIVGGVVMFVIIRKKKANKTK